MVTHLVNFIGRGDDRHVDVLLGQLRDGGEVADDEGHQVGAHLDSLLKLIPHLVAKEFSSVSSVASYFWRATEWSFRGVLTGYSFMIMCDCLDCLDGAKDTSQEFNKKSSFLASTGQLPKSHSAESPLRHPTL